MKGIAQLSIILPLCIGLVSTEAGTKDEQPKPQLTSGNAINLATKPEHFNYQQFAQFGARFQPQQAINQQQYQPKTQYLQQSAPYQQHIEAIKKSIGQSQHHATPIAMVIIAQPAYIPASLLQQRNVAQALVNLFQGNNPARFQYLPHGHYPQIQPNIITHVQQQQVPQYAQYHSQQDIQYHPPTSPNENPPQAAPMHSNPTHFQHESLPTPEALISDQEHQNHLVPHLHQAASEGRSIRYQPLQNHLEEQPIPANHKPDYQKPLELDQISQLAQQAAQQYLMSGGTGAAPAIITGLENFSPEQQVKIKAQLGAYFGAPLQPLKVAAEEKGGMVAGNQRQQEPMKRSNSEKFVPSIEVKNGQITQIRSSRDIM
ncbi:putative mediator of RNA polymerase II transcription subunit 12 [Sitophilus oryzae]|uniref:Mediator of RNA polymerase II transcription subunit 12 n=1 Tax=Sitophilus oryzae TaxID=7048 RepID=A0A6J2YXR9_SITOR|nr:putative mediator of RNA polymerase II transcription subunit 12 [Sitophilus oryzae]